MDTDSDGRGDACDLPTEPSALDLDPSAPPLRVTLVAGAIGLTWQDVGADGHDVYRGTIASLDRGLHDHSRTTACGVSATAATLVDDPGSFYFLVTSRVGGLSSSYGRDSRGRERPIGQLVCP